MTVDTKFSIGDTVWLINERRIVKEKVTGINIKVVNEMNMLITYSLEGFNVTFNESVLFDSRDSLIDNLIEESDK